MIIPPGIGVSVGVGVGGIGVDVAVGGLGVNVAVGGTGVGVDVDRTGMGVDWGVLHATNSSKTNVKLIICGSNFLCFIASSLT